MSVKLVNTMSSQKSQTVLPEEEYLEVIIMLCILNNKKHILRIMHKI